MTRECTLSSIEDHEGFKANTYLDSLGLWTFAIGRCLETNPLTGAEWKWLLDAGHITVSITHEGAQALSAASVDDLTLKLSSVLVGWYGYPEAVRDVLTEMAYQMGIDKLSKFRNMLAAAERHDWTEMAHEGRNSLWARQTPKRADQLMKRIEAIV